MSRKQKLQEKTKETSICRGQSRRKNTKLKLE